MPLTPLDIALQEYAYWRAAGDDDRLLDIGMGAMGAAANIAGRLAGGNLEGIDYQSLSPEEVTRVLQEIRMAPKMASALLVIHEFFAKLEAGLPSDDPLSKLRAEFHKPVHAVLEPLIAELNQGGPL